ncbi:condensation domain-containing protein [Arenibaculum sp.]|uniref:condensation domain-containing protein n=1 Tax=Arenibaculum sp. TaxID=2865862 RepID=UPI002E109CD7|nr:condensation domain-containing protein [Arenibaculum sp.]
MDAPEEREDCARYLDDLRKRGIAVRLDPAGLKCTADRGSVPPDVVEDLRRRRPALVRYLESRPSAASELVRQPCTGTVPLGKGQATRLAWARRALADGLPALYAVGLVELEEPVDTGRLFRALRALYARHLIFGARLSSSSDGWHYRTGTDAGDPDSSARAAGVPVPVAPGALGAALRGFLAAPLAPEDAPLARVKVFAPGNSRAVVAFWLNPLFADAWSTWVLKTDFLRAYRTPDTDIGPPPLQFSDYILWKIDNDRFVEERQIPFWRDALHGWPAHDPGSPQEDGHRTEGKATFFTLAPDLCRDLREVCRLHRTTPFSALFALFQILVGTLRSRNDVVTGVVGGRAMPALRDAVAFCANYVPIRTRLHPELSYLDLFLSVQKSCAAANEHSYPHAEDLCHVLETGRALGSAQFHFNPLPVTGQFSARDCYREWKRLSGCLRRFAADEDVRMTVLDDGGSRIYVVLSTREDARPPGAGTLAARYGQLVEMAAKDPFARCAS